MLKAGELTVLEAGIMAGEEETLLALQTLGLSEQKAKETVKNAAVTKVLLNILNQVCKIFFL